MARLKELLQAIELVGGSEIQDVEITGVAYHSKKVVPGNLIVCIKGYKTDGHRYLPEAIAQGAAAAIVEELQPNLEIPQYLVKDGRVALAQLANTFYGHPSKALTMIGITATNGKTTTSYMVNSMLERWGLKTGLVGTVMVKIGDHSTPSDLTTPESLDLQRYLREMVEAGVTHTTMEVSSSALELHRVLGVDYDIVTLNNISREHIDAHGSFERYFEVKSGLIRNAKASAFAVLNLDCPYASSLVDKTQAQVITFGVNKADGHIHCKNLDLSTGRGRFILEIRKPFQGKGVTYEPQEIPMELSVPGLHSVYNAMMAITVAMIVGVPMEVIQATLRNFQGVERRFEFIFEDEIKIIDDHFANPGNINVTLQTLDYMDYNRLHLVYAIRGERGTTVNRENSEAIVEWAQKLGFNEIIATKSVSHVTSKDRVTDEELAVFLEVMERAQIKVYLYDELTDAIAFALGRAQAGDLVLLAGCQGMDYGAEIALKQLHQRMASYPKEKLFYPLRNRVAGVTENYHFDEL